LKPAVLFAGELPVEDVVEQELPHHAGTHEVDFPAGQVNENGLELSDFARDVQPHAAGILSDRPFRRRSARPASR